MGDLDAVLVEDGPGLRRRLYASSNVAHLFERIRIEQNPTEFDDLGRVLGNIHPMLITGSRDVDHDVAVDGEGGSWLLRRHAGQKTEARAGTHGTGVRPVLQRRCV